MEKRQAFEMVDHGLGLRCFIPFVFPVLLDHGRHFFVVAKTKHFFVQYM